MLTSIKFQKILEIICRCDLQSLTTNFSRIILFNSQHGLSTDLRKTHLMYLHFIQKPFYGIDVNRILQRFISSFTKTFGKGVVSRTQIELWFHLCRNQKRMMSDSGFSLENPLDLSLCRFLTDRLGTTPQKVALVVKRSVTTGVPLGVTPYDSSEFTYTIIYDSF